MEISRGQSCVENLAWNEFALGGFRCECWKPISSALSQLLKSRVEHLAWEILHWECLSLFDWYGFFVGVFHMTTVGKKSRLCKFSLGNLAWTISCVECYLEWLVHQVFKFDEHWSNFCSYCSFRVLGCAHGGIIWAECTMMLGCEWIDIFGA